MELNLLTRLIIFASIILLMCKYLMDFSWEDSFYASVFIGVLMIISDFIKRVHKQMTEKEKDRSI